MNDFLAKLLSMAPQSQDQKFDPRDLLVSQAATQAQPEEITQEDPLSNLEDKGYVPPTREQQNSSGFKAAQNVFSGKMNSSPLVGTAPAEAMGAYEDRRPATLEDLVPTQNAQPPVDVIAPFMKNSTAEEAVKSPSYQDAIDRRDRMLREADLREGTAGLAAALAGGKSQYSAKNLREQAELPTQDFTKGIEARNLEELNNSSSDISKFAQERANTLLKAINPESPLLGKLNGMTAAQLKTVFGDKVLGGSVDKPKFTQIVGRLSASGMPLLKNDSNGEVFELGNMKTPYDASKGTAAAFPKGQNDAFGRPWSVDMTTGKKFPVFPFDPNEMPTFVEGPNSQIYDLNGQISPTVNSAQQQPTSGTTKSTNTSSEPKQIKSGIIQKTEDEDDSAYLNKFQQIKPSAKKDLDSITDEIKSNSDISKLNEAVGNIDASKALVEGNLPGSAPMLARALLSIYESGGKFTDADVEQMKGPTDVKAKMKRFLVTNFDADQAVSETDQAAQMELLKLLENKKTEQLSAKYAPYVNRLSKFGMDKDVAARYVTGDRVNSFSELGSLKSLNVNKNKQESSTPPNSTIGTVNGVQYYFDKDTKKNLGKVK